MSSSVLVLLSLMSPENKVGSQMWCLFSEVGIYELQLVVLCGAAPHSETPLKRRSGWIQSLGCHGYRRKLREDSTPACT